MTCIVGKAVDGRIYMGADSCAAGDWFYYPCDRPKIFKKEHLLIGFTSTYRWGDILEHELEVPRFISGRQLAMTYLVKELVPAIRRAMDKSGHLHKEDGVEDGGTALIGCDGQVFIIQDDFSILPGPEYGIACGCGQEVAMAALKAMMLCGTTVDPEMQIYYALRTAGEMTNGVCGPYHMIKMAKNNKVYYTKKG